MSYARMLEGQARLLAAFVRGGIPTDTGLPPADPRRSSRVHWFRVTLPLAIDFDDAS